MDLDWDLEMGWECFDNRHCPKTREKDSIKCIVIDGISDHMRTINRYSSWQ